MAESFLLEIVTPTGTALREQVSAVTAPGLSGEFGVLPGHLPMLSALRTGLVTYQHGGSEQALAIAHGFAEVSRERTLLLTEKVATKDSVDVVQIRLRLKEVDDALDHWQGELTDPKRRDLIEEEQWLATVLELIGDPPPATVREDTRFLADKAASLPEDEMVAGSEPDTSLTHQDGEGSGSPDTK